MRSKSSLLAAMLFGAAIAAGGCSNLGQKSAGATIDDATIITKVKAKFVEDKAVSAMNIQAIRTARDRHGRTHTWSALSARSDASASIM